MSETVYLLADKVNDNYSASELARDPSDIMGSFEYGDVAKGEFQIWEYPSGKIYAVEADREVPKSDYYSTSYTTKGVMWLPKLVEIGTDRQKVEEAYVRLTAASTRPGLFGRAARRLKTLFNRQEGR